MDWITIAATAAITSLTSGIVGAIVASVISVAKAKATNHADQSEAIREALGALLWREIKRIHTEAMKNNGISIEERRQLEHVFSAYSRGLNFNGTGERMFKDAMNKPILD